MKNQHPELRFVAVVRCYFVSLSALTKDFTVPKTLKVANEAGRYAGNKSAFCHGACFNVVELKTCVVTHHLA